MSSDQVVQLVIAGFGFTATLAAVALGWWLNSRGEARRLRLEDERRWQADRFRVLSSIQALGAQIDRDVAHGIQAYRVFRNVSAFADRTDADENVMGVMLEHVNALPGKWADASSEGYRMISDLELLTKGTVVDLAYSMMAQYKEVIDSMTGLGPLSSIESQYEAAGELRQKMIEAARAILSPA